MQMGDLEALKTIIAECETVSFDFFDTLVARRSASPEAVQHYIGFRLSRERGGLEGFFERRVQAERTARARHPEIGDVDLGAIYAEFPTDAQWTSDAVARAKELEPALDSRFVWPRPGVIELARYAKKAGKRVIVVSDSFYPRAFFDDLVRRFGWSDLIDAIYLSSEVKARKDAGTLWSLVVAREGLSGKRFVHFGDNPRSDVETAATAGLRGVLIPGPPALAAERGIGHRVGRDWPADLLLGPAVALRGGYPYSRNATITDEREFGYLVYGPIFLAFFAWLVTHPAVQQLERLFFSSREGHFLQRLYDRLREHCGFEGLPGSSYLPMSRRAVITASLAVSFEPSRVTDRGGFRGTVESLFRARLGYDLNWPSRFVLPVRLPEDRTYVQKLLEILRPQLLARAQVERVAMRAYCESVGLTSGAEVGLVDIGYSGTIQTLLQLILGRPLAGFYMATAPGVASVRAGGGEAYGCFQDALRGDMRPDGFMRKTVLLEALLTAPHGQLSHFELDESERASPVFTEPGVSQRYFSALERVFEGGVDYCLAAIEAGGREMLGAIVSARGSAFLPLEAAFAGDIRVGEAIAEAMYLDDAYCGNGEIAGLPEAAVDRLRA